MKRKITFLVLASVLSMSFSVNADLVANWTMNDTLEDISGNGYDAFQGQNDAGDATFVADNPFDDDSLSVSFNDNSYLGTPLSWEDSGITNAFTVSTWFKSDFDDVSLFFLLDFDRSENITAAIGDYAYAAVTNTSGKTTDAKAEPESWGDEWHHYLLSYGEVNGLALYIDGQLVLTSDYIGTLGTGDYTRYATIGDGSESVTPGGAHHKAYVDGQIADLALWDEEYTQAYYVSSYIYNEQVNAIDVSNVDGYGAGISSLLAFSLLGWRRNKKHLNSN